MHVLDKFRYCPVCGSKHFAEQNKKSKHCEGCDFEYLLNSSSAVATFILNEQGELLVTRRKSEPGRETLSLPSGFCDIGGTIGEALIREVRKKTNLTVRGKHYFCSFPNKYRYSDFDASIFGVFFVYKAEDETVLRVADDVEEAMWFLLSEIHTERFGLRSIRQALCDFLQVEPESLKR